MNRSQARKFAEARFLDAEALLNAGRWHAAYYFVGYAVECGLKACVLAYVEATGVIFDDKRFGEKCFTHDLEVLVKLANLDEARGLDIKANPLRGASWDTVEEWNLDVRYREIEEAKARELYEAIADPANGVLAWIKTVW